MEHTLAFPTPFFPQGVLSLSFPLSRSFSLSLSLFPSSPHSKVHGPFFCCNPFPEPVSSMAHFFCVLLWLIF